MVQLPHSLLGRVLPRRAQQLIEDALADTRVVLVNGARQCGKSTLVAQVARQTGAAWFTLDRPDTLKAARHDPVAFVRSAPTMIIDEVQRAPELFLAMKELVDADPVPGRFLLTGSARVLGLRGLPDAIPGRMETIELWPLSQGEIDTRKEGLVEALFTGDPINYTSQTDRDDYIARMTRGGFPDAVAREGLRRERFFESYVADLINRDVMQLSTIESGHRMRTLVELLSGRMGQVFTIAGLARSLGLSQQTVERYVTLLEEVFLIKRIPGWGGVNVRATSSPKLMFVDSGIAAMMLGVDEASLRRINGPIGPLLENFVAAEIARQITWAPQRIELFHYRTRDQVEVDILLRNRRHQFVAIEVKASATAHPDDFRGIRHLQARLGDDLVAGIVLYLGQQTLPFGDGLRAVPVAALWEVSGSSSD